MRTEIKAKLIGPLSRGIRVNARRASVVLLSVLAVLAAGAGGATAAHADVGAGPAYFLSSVGTGQPGPCADRVGDYQGEISIEPYDYRWQYMGHNWIGDVSVYEYQDQGFDTAAEYLGCYGSYPAYGYYGAHKISRVVSIEYECPADQGGCLYRGTHYGDWRADW